MWIQKLTAPPSYEGHIVGLCCISECGYIHDTRRHVRYRQMPSDVVGTAKKARQFYILALRLESQQPMLRLAMLLLYARAIWSVAYVV